MLILHLLIDYAYTDWNQSKYEKITAVRRYGLSDRYDKLLRWTSSKLKN